MSKWQTFSFNKNYIIYELYFFYIKNIIYTILFVYLLLNVKTTIQGILVRTFCIFEEPTNITTMQLYVKQIIQISIKVQKMTILSI